MNNEKKRDFNLTENERWLLENVAQFLRGASFSEEGKSESAFSLAFKLDEIGRRWDKSVK